MVRTALVARALAHLVMLDMHALPRRLRHGRHARLGRIQLVVRLPAPSVLLGRGVLRWVRSVSVHLGRTVRMATVCAVHVLQGMPVRQRRHLQWWSVLRVRIAKGASRSVLLVRVGLHVLPQCCPSRFSVLLVPILPVRRQSAPLVLLGMSARLLKWLLQLFAVLVTSLERVKVAAVSVLRAVTAVLLRMNPESVLLEPTQVLGRLLVKHVLTAVTVWEERAVVRCVLLASRVRVR